MSNDGALLLAIDVGNTNISFGLFDVQRKLRADWRLETRTGRTADEYIAILSELFRRAGIDLGNVKAAAVSSVVPPILAPIERLCRVHLNLTPLIVGPGTKTGVPVLYENPREVGRGPDRQRGRRVRSLAAGLRSSSTSAPRPPSTSSPRGANTWAASSPRA